MRVFFHIAAMNSGWYNIYREIYDGILSSGLLEAVDKLVVGFLGSPQDFNKLSTELIGEKYELNYFGSNFEQYEFPTLNLLQQYCQTSDQPVLYVHTKGSSNPAHTGKRYWRKAIIKSIVLDWRRCIELLDNSDLVGYNLHRPRRKGQAPIHFSGNCWWAKSSYIRTCVPILELKARPRYINNWMVGQPRFQCEFWLRTGNWLKAVWKSTGVENADREHNIDPIISLDDPPIDPFDSAGLLVDKRFLINVEGQDDRLESALIEISRERIRDVEIFGAFTIGEVLKRYQNIPLKTPGQVGCYLSHKACIYHAFTDKANALLIIEDDVSLSYRFDALFKDAYYDVPKDWDVLFIGSLEKNRGPYVHIKNRVWQTGDHWGTHCYLLSRTGIEKMHDYLKNNPIEWEIDMLMVHHMPDLKKYSVNPTLAYQKPFKSNTRPPKPTNDGSQATNRIL